MQTWLQKWFRFLLLVVAGYYKTQESTTQTFIEVSMKTFLFILFCCLGGIALAQTVTQLDNDHYFTQFQDGTNETISYQQTSTNVNSCLNLINRYQPVLNEINQGNEVTSQQLQTAIQSVQTTAVTAQPALGQQVVNGT